MRSNGRKVRPAKILFIIWLVIALIFLFLPIVQIIVLSFNTSIYTTFPFEFTTQWYEKLFNGSDLIKATLLSLVFGVAVSTAAAILGIMASLGLRKAPAKVNNIFNITMDIPLIVPWLVQAVALLMIFTLTGLGRSMVAMFFGNLIAVMPHSFMLTYSRVMTMDPYPEEAGRTLGATSMQVFKDITFRMIFPAALAGWLMSFVLCFNCFALQYYLAPFGTYTLPMRIFTLIRSGCKPDVNALATFMVIITFIVIFLLNKIGFGAEQLFGGRRKED